MTAAAVMLLNPFVDRTLKMRSRALRIRLPGCLSPAHLDLARSARVRTRGSCLNAQVHPLMEEYLAKLDERVSVVGEHLLHLTSSAGGTMSVQSARERPIDTMLSGPASGAVAAARLCSAASIPAALSFDMGGTSADIAVITEGQVGYTTSSRLAISPMMPVVGVSAIGAGGGSIVSVDRHGC